jgi:hypothetical protein
MFNRQLFTGGIPRFTPPAPFQIDEIQCTLRRLEERGHSIDMIEHKIPSGSYMDIS